MLPFSPPRSRHLSLASVEGSLTANINKDELWLWARTFAEYVFLLDKSS
jgi:hypothetical protein